MTLAHFRDFISIYFPLSNLGLTRGFWHCGAFNNTYGWKIFVSIWISNKGAVNVSLYTWLLQHGRFKSGMMWVTLSVWQAWKRSLWLVVWAHSELYVLKASWPDTARLWLSTFSDGFSRLNCFWSTRFNSESFLKDKLF